MACVCWSRQKARAKIASPATTVRINRSIHVCAVAAGTVDEMKRDRVIGKISAQEAFKRHLEQI
jgi:hypothetical protein